MKRAWMAFLVVVACACTSTPEEISMVSSALTGPGCDPGRRVGIPSLATWCPHPAGTSWTVSHLFQQPAVITEGGHPFCLYEYVGPPAGFTTAGLPTDPGTGTSGADWTDADCLGVVALGDDPAEIVTKSHALASWAQMGRPAELPRVGPFPASVRVAVLDSSVDSAPSEVEPTTGEFLHGRAVSLANRDYTCPRGRGDVCIPDFDTRLVLDQGGNPHIAGGHYGSIATLATALEDVVVNTPLGDNLIIPLALGWHPRFNHVDGAPSEPESNTIKAVRAALEYAACQNVLVLAAAGNRTGSDDEDGLLCPACWQESVTDCGDVHPLVYAVGGLEPDGTPLAISRNQGQPPLAAAAAGISSIDPDETLGVWTGTSMGVAHVGAAATLVWGYMPHLSADEVMQWVTTASTPMREQADVCADPNQECPPVGRVTACDTLRVVLGRGSPVCEAYACPEDLPCEAQPEAVPELDASTLDQLLSLTNQRPVEQSFAEKVEGATCSVAVYGARLDPTQEYCPWEVEPSYASTPYSVDSQPGSDPCGACAVITGRPDSVYMAIDPNLVGYLHWPTLSAPSFGNLALSDAMQSHTLVAGDVASVPLDGLQATFNGSAQLSFLWSKTLTSTPIQVSVQIPVY